MPVVASDLRELRQQFLAHFEQIFGNLFSHGRKGGLR